jgi:serine/threonine protein kinase
VELKSGSRLAQRTGMREGQRLLSKSSIEIIRLLGEGGFGKVYLVKKSFLNGLLPRFYALKCFHNNVGPEVLMAEARALFGVRSHHCVTVHSVEEFEGGCGLLLEFVDGVTLAELCRTHVLSTEEQANILLQTKQGLEDLAAAGLTHGDLTPKNIMIDKNGKVVLLDFGLPAFFNNGVVVGATDYMSESRKKGASPNFEDDLYSLKLIAFDLENNLIGRPKPPRNLLFLDQSLQKMQKFSPKASPSLKSKVQEILAGSEYSVRTRVFEGQSANFLRLVNFLFILALVPATQASTRKFTQAWLSVRSLNWIEVETGGKTLSSSQEGINLSPGKHLLKWQTAKRTGIKGIELAEGEKLILLDSDFD